MSFVTKDTAISHKYRQSYIRLLMEYHIIFTQHRPLVTQSQYHRHAVQQATSTALHYGRTSVAQTTATVINNILHVTGRS